MKKLLLIAGLLWSALANAQFVPGQVLTAAELNSAFALYAPLAGANFSGLVSAAGITGTPISGSTGSFTNLSASGSVSFPAGTVTPGSLAPQAANTVLANTLGATASPTAAVIPSCSTSSSGLQWTSGTGFACNTAVNASTLGGVAAGSYLTSATAASTYAPLASPTFTGTVTVPTAATSSNTTTAASTAFVQQNFTSPTFAIGGGVPNAGTFTTLSSTGGALNGTLGATTPNTGSFTTVRASGAITPATAAGIVGTTIGDNASAGSWGEYVTVGGGPAPVSSGVSTSVGVFTLTPGDWDVQAIIQFSDTAAGMNQWYTGVSTTLNTLGALGTYTEDQTGAQLTNLKVGASPIVRLSLATSTAVYATGNVTFSTGTTSLTTVLRARRVR